MTENTMNNATENTMNEGKEVNTMNENKIENTATMINTIDKYEKETAQGYEVVNRDYNFTPYTIIKRDTVYPYVVAYQYDVTTGTWAQGFYDFENIDKCYEFIALKTIDKDKKAFYEVSFELPNGIKCITYIHGTYNNIIEYFERIEDAKNIDPKPLLKPVLKSFNELESKDDLIDKAVGMLEDDNDLFTNCVDILDSYNGFASDYRLFDMYDLDDELSDKTPTEIIELVADTGFNTNDDYFCYDGYDIYSVCDKYEHYINHTDEQEVIDNLLSEFNGIRTDLRSLNDELFEILDKIDEMN